MIGNSIVCLFLCLFDQTIDEFAQVFLLLANNTPAIWCRKSIYKPTGNTYLHEFAHLFGYVFPSLGCWAAYKWTLELLHYRQQVDVGGNRKSQMPSRATRFWWGQRCYRRRRRGTRRGSGRRTSNGTGLGRRHGDRTFFTASPDNRSASSRSSAAKTRSAIADLVFALFKLSALRPQVLCDFFKKKIASARFNSFRFVDLRPDRPRPADETIQTSRDDSSHPGTLNRFVS